MSKRNKKGDKVKQETLTKKDVIVVTPKVAAKEAPKSPEAASAAPDTGAVAAATSPASVKADPPRPLKIKVLKKDGTFRGARLAWYQRLVEFDGKTEGEFIADTKERPPSLTKNGTAEPPAGWVGFFKRQGIISLTA